MDLESKQGKELRGHWAIGVLDILAALNGASVAGGVGAADEAANDGKAADDGEGGGGGDGHERGGEEDDFGEHGVRFGLREAWKAGVKVGGLS